MNFLQPAMLWSLLALLPLIAIYFLKVRPRRRLTTAFFLWEKVFQEKRTSSLFQRLRDVLSLLLMMLATGAVCLALARPEWSTERQDLLIVIDNSASMGARDGNSTRLDEAKKLAKGLVEGLNGSQRAAVASAGRVLTYRSHLTDNPRELLGAIDQIDAMPEPLSLATLAELAEAGNKWRERRRVILLSDAGFDTQRLPPDAELFKIGAATDNVGLIAADLAYLPGAENRLGVYFQTASSHAETFDCDLTVVRIEDDGREHLLKVIPLSIDPGVNPPETFTLENTPPGRCVMRIDVDDALLADNTAYLVAHKPPPIRVAVESEDRFFLENSVLAFAGTTNLLALDVVAPEVVVAKSHTPAAPRSIVFQPEGDSPWWSELGPEVEVAAPRVLQPDHPALAHLDGASIPFVGARRLTPPEGAQVLVADDAGLALIYIARREGRSSVVVNLDPILADFYFSAWFPVLVHSSVVHLVGRETPLAATYRPGELAPSLASNGGGPSTLSTEVGTVSETRGKWIALPPTLGFYELTNDAGRWELGASLLSDQETLLVNEKAVDSRQPIRRGHSPAHWLTLLAVLVLTGESILYHRRKVG